MDNLVFSWRKSFYYLSDRKITVKISRCVVQSGVEGTADVNFLKTRGRRILIKCGEA